MTNRRSSAGQTSSAAAAALAVQTNLANFVNEQDPRSLFWMVSQMNDQPLDQLAAVQVDQLRQALLTRTEIDVNHWKERIQSFLAGPIHEIDWTPFAGLAPAERPAAQPQPEPVVAQSPEPRGAPPNVAGVNANSGINTDQCPTVARPGQCKTPQHWSVFLTGFGGSRLRFPGQC